ncbi:hypothetical protein ARMA_2388 [Ardenticatena maritima]|uniref:Uncharacterized protein n=1 Tax=Ardenticatena maritima TaxID=872965 RepID=A0A0M8K8K0_9CHLR|nr:hypothetical protein ARMA_2388 [Ardenticatena maritima]
MYQHYAQQQQPSLLYVSPASCVAAPCGKSQKPPHVCGAAWETTPRSLLEFVQR